MLAFLKKDSNGEFLFWKKCNPDIMDIWTEACFLWSECEQSCAAPKSDEISVPGSLDTELH